jgi:tetratricopeptide (TPR) repeat protein
MNKILQLLLIYFLLNIALITPGNARDIDENHTVIQTEFETAISKAKKEALTGNYESSLKDILETLDKSSSGKQFIETEALIRYIYNSTGNPDYLNSYYDKLEKLVSSNMVSPAFDILLKSYEEIKNYEGIINLYRMKLLATSNSMSDQDKSLIFEKIGDLYELLNQSPLNKDNFKRAVEFNEKNLRAREKLAFSLLLSGELREAEKLYKKALELNPGSDNAHLGLGIITYIKGDAKNAAEEFKLVQNKDKNAALLELIVKYELAKGTVSNLFRYWAF